MSKKIEIIMDNGGGLQLQTTKFAHSYESTKKAQQCADDILEFMLSGDTSEWEGNEPHYRRGPTESDQTLDRAELEAILAAGRAIARVASGHTARELVMALLGEDVCEAIYTEYDRTH